MHFHATDSLPSHVAIIMDGNGRWAKNRCMPRKAGHKAGLEAARRVVGACIQRGIKYLTLFTFSSENWRRPQEEVSFLIQLLTHCVEKEVKQLHKKQVKLQFIGNLGKFPLPLQKKIKEAESLTANNIGLTVVLAINYGGQWDIVEAAKQMCKAVERGEIELEAVDPDYLARYLSTANIPPPDLLIRTSGERRISNFLLWQLAYTELYFTDTLWPDFDEEALDEGLHFYRSRERRFGCITEQLKEA